MNPRRLSLRLEMARRRVQRTYGDHGEPIHWIKINGQPIPTVDGVGGGYISKEPPPASVGPTLQETEDLFTFNHFNGQVAVLIDRPYAVSFLAAQIIGRPLEDREWAELVGAPDGSQIFVDVSGEFLAIRTEHPWFACPQLRRIYRVQDEVILDLVRSHYGFKAPDELGLHSLAFSVWKARQLEFARIHAYAAGSWEDPDYQGYYALARLGFDAVLLPDDLTRIPDTGGAKTLNGLMLAGLEDDWLEHGCGRHVDLVLDEHGIGMNAFLKLLERRRIGVGYVGARRGADGVDAVDFNTSMIWRPVEEGIALSPEEDEDAALAWADMAGYWNPDLTPRNDPAVLEKDGVVQTSGSWAALTKPQRLARADETPRENSSLLTPDSLDPEKQGDHQHRPVVVHGHRKPGQFECYSDLLVWGQQRFPRLLLELGALPIALINPMMERFEKLAEHLPEVGGSDLTRGAVEFITTGLGSGDDAWYASDTPGQIEVLSRDNPPTSLADMKERARRRGGLAATHPELYTPDGVMAQAFGGQVRLWLETKGDAQAWTPVVGNDGFGVVASAPSFFGQYAACAGEGLGEPETPDAAWDHRFAMMYLTGAGHQPESVQCLSKLLAELLTRAWETDAIVLETLDGLGEIAALDALRHQRSLTLPGAATDKRLEERYPWLRSSFIPGRAIEDAAEAKRWAGALYATADHATEFNLDGWAPRSLQECLTEFYWLANTFPEVAAALATFGSGPTPQGQVARGVTDTGGGGHLVFNAEIMRDPEPTVHLLGVAEMSGVIPVGTGNLGGVVAHEWGHLLVAAIDEAYRSHGQGTPVRDFCAKHSPPLRFSVMADPYLKAGASVAAGKEAFAAAFASIRHTPKELQAPYVGLVLRFLQSLQVPGWGRPALW